ncbi:hypothetical protein AMTRI_Chr12g269940 [Amborella trichopoda]
MVTILNDIHPNLFEAYRGCKRGALGFQKIWFGPKSSPLQEVSTKANTKLAVMGSESNASLMEELRKAFSELEFHRNTTTNSSVDWKDLEQHFSSLESALKKKYEELEEKEKLYEARASENCEILAKREAEVTAKEEVFWERVQEKRNAAVAAIEEAREKVKALFEGPEEAMDEQESKVKNSKNVQSNAPICINENTSGKSGAPANTVASEIKPRPELKQFCEQMDAKGLLKFIAENRKVLAQIREELPVAIKDAFDPAQLVLDSLEGFYPQDQTAQPGDKKDAALQGQRRACILLMQSVAPVFGGNESSGDLPVITSEHKKKAMAVADEWRPKLTNFDADADNGNSLEAQAFLQLLSTFSIATEFDGDELCKLVLAVSRRRHTPELCRSLGLAYKMPGLIESLIISKKQIEAVNFAQAFNLTERFPPVPLLKSYLKDAKKDPQGNNGNASAASSQKDANSRELVALRAVIRCIEEHKLEEQYPLEQLQKRVNNLEKAKAQKKRTGESSKPQPKRAKAIGSVRQPSHVAVERQPTALDDRGLYRGGADPYSYPSNADPYSYPSNAATYNYSSMHSGYERPTQVLYTQPSLQQAYINPDGTGSAASYNPPSNYGVYYATAPQSSYHPSSYM